MIPLADNTPVCACGSCQRRVTTKGDPFAEGDIICVSMNSLRLLNHDAGAGAKKCQRCYYRLLIVEAVVKLALLLAFSAIASPQSTHYSVVTWDSTYLYNPKGTSAALFRNVKSGGKEGGKGRCEAAVSTS
jgi:hypothetical protein